MKAILIICVLLASINLFSLSSIFARELIDHHDQSDASGGKIGDPNNPAIKCDPKTPYSHCIGQTKQKPKCDPKGPYTRCTGTSPSGNPNNPGSPAVKPGTGTDPKGPIIKCDPSNPTYKSCVAKQNPKGKSCVPGASGAYTRCPPKDP